MRKERLTKKMNIMLDTLRKNGFNVSNACKVAKISRQTHYSWLDKNDRYKKACDEIEEALLDMVETSLLKNIKSGNVTAQIFYLKTKGKSRGYIETVENVNIDVNSDKSLESMSIEELAELRKRLESDLYGNRR